MKKDSNEKKLCLKEEKNEGPPRRVAPTKLEVLQESLPSELKGNVYEDEDDLWEAQDKIGLSDLQIVLNSEGYAVWREMPDTKHNSGVGTIRMEFWKWKQEQSAMLDAEKGADVFVSRSFERNRKRCPDFAIWGPDRLNERGSVRGNAHLGKPVNPHVTFQFSWGNKIEREKLAVDDMSMYGGVGIYEPLGRPNVLYLIKVKRKGDPSPQPDSHVHGFDVYVVRPGELIDTANPALTYRVGENEDITIEVTPEDMGLPQDANPFLISLSSIRADMEELGVVFEAENQDE
jgi:hypothetical protein